MHLLTSTLHLLRSINTVLNYHDILNYLLFSENQFLGLTTMWTVIFSDFFRLYWCFLNSTCCQNVSLPYRLTTCVPEFANWMLMETSVAWIQELMSAFISTPFRDCISCVLRTQLAKSLCFWIMTSIYMRSCPFSLWAPGQWGYHKSNIWLGHTWYLFDNGAESHHPSNLEARLPLCQKVLIYLAIDTR